MFRKHTTQFIPAQPTQTLTNFGLYTFFYTFLMMFLMINRIFVLVLWLTAQGSRAGTSASQHNLGNMATSNVVISPLQMNLKPTPPHYCQLIMLPLFLIRYRHFLILRTHRLHLQGLQRALSIFFKA